MWTYGLKADGCEFGPAAEACPEFEYDSEEDAKDAAKDDIESRVENSEGENPTPASEYVATTVSDNPDESGSQYSYAELCKDSSN